MNEWPLKWKVLIVIVYSIFSIIFYKSFLILAIFALVVSVVSIRDYRKLITLSAYLFIITLISQGFFYYGYYQNQPVRILLWVLKPDYPVLGKITGGIALTLEGILHGTIVGAKIVTLMLLGVAFANSVKVSEIVRIIKKYSPELALSLSIVIRYIPIILDDFRDAYSGLITRGFNKRGKIQIIRLLFKAVIVNLSKRAESISITMYFRGHAR